MRGCDFAPAARISAAAQAGVTARCGSVSVERDRGRMLTGKAATARWGAEVRFRRLRTLRAAGLHRFALAIRTLQLCSSHAALSRLSHCRRHLLHLHTDMGLGRRRPHLVRRLPEDPARWHCRARIEGTCRASHPCPEPRPGRRRTPWCDSSAHTDLMRWALGRRATASCPRLRSRSPMPSGLRPFT